MIYNTSSLESVAQCDLILEELAAEASNISARISLAQTAINDVTDEVTDLPAEIATIEQQIAALDVQIAAETDTKRRNDLKIDRNSADNKLIRLQNRLGSLAGVRLLDRQYGLAKNQSKLLALQEFQAAVNVRKTALEGVAGAA